MAWIQQTKAERTFDILIQDQEADCGLCCVAMVVNLLGQGKPSSSMVKNNLPKGAYKPSTKDRVGFAPSMLSAVLPDVSTHSGGTYLANLQEALTKWQIASVDDTASSNVQAAIQGAVAGKPIINHVTWTNGGGHWVVISHAMGASYYILDPYYGLTVGSSLTKYAGLVQDGANVGKVTTAEYGTWTGEWLKITGMM